MLLEKGGTDKRCGGGHDLGTCSGGGNTTRSRGDPIQGELPTVSRCVISGTGHLLHQAGPQVREPVLELNVLCDGDSVLGDLWPTE